MKNICVWVLSLLLVASQAFAANAEAQEIDIDHMDPKEYHAFSATYKGFTMEITEEGTGNIFNLTDPTGTFSPMAPTREVIHQMRRILGEDCEFFIGKKLGKEAMANLYPPEIVEKVIRHRHRERHELLRWRKARDDE